jgi:hypothetical protein
MATRRQLRIPLLFAVSAALLVGSGGVIFVISTNLVSNDGSSADRWEPTSASGTTWVHAWAQIQDANSFASSWNGGSWNPPQPLTAPNGLGTNDVNMNWDSVRSRYVVVALDFGSPHNVWYGYSMDSSGTSWVFGNNNQPIFSASTADWDYPSVGVDASGRVIVGAVAFPGPSGYYSVVSSDGNTFSSPSFVTSSGAQSRVVATDSRFEAFVPTLNGDFLPTYIARYESTDGVNWSGDLGIGLGSFAPPNNNTPPGTSSIILFYAPLLAAQGYTNGLWTVAFQVNNAGYNNVVICSSDRGCGIANSYPDDQFLVGASVSGDAGYWISYYTYQNPRNPPLITQAIYFPAGQPGIGATTNSGIDPTTWTTTQPRCSATCYAAGDFQTVSSNPYASADTPFIQAGYGRPNDLFQSFVEDPQAIANVPNFKPNFVPIPRGASITNLGLPVPTAAAALNPALKIGVRRP